MAFLVVHPVHRASGNAVSEIINTWDNLAAKEVSAKN